jgi:pyruvate dehydrogenase E2 component (dihydrolipoamide acetyltransferase)
MAEFKLPDMGEDIDEAEVLKVLVSKGDRIEKEQAVLELETDKATFEVPSSVAGTVGEVHVGEGDRLKVGQTVLTVEEGEASKDGEAGGSKKKKEEKEKGKEDERAAKEEGAAEAEEEPDGDEREEKAEEERARRKKKKAAREEPDEEREPEEPEGDEEDAEDEREEKSEDKSARRKKKAPKEEPDENREGEEAPRAKKTSERRTSETGEVAAGPATRRLARELGVDLARVTGEGPGGRVTRDDVKAAARKDSETGADEKEAAGLPDFERFGAVERRRLTGIERAAVGHLSRAWRTIPHVTQHDEADVTELETMRRRFEERRRPSDPKLTATALVIKAAVAALKAFPRVNASLDVEREELVLKRYVHIGVAVDTDDGLLVPVVRDADGKTTRQIAGEIAGLAERARERKLTRDEMEGASFTITNLGGIGGTAFTPVVPHPQVAILGVSRVREAAMVREEEIVVRLVMPLSLSYDHRALNGADAARFTRHVASLLEDPLRLLAES